MTLFRVVVVSIVFVVIVSLRVAISALKRKAKKTAAKLQACFCVRRPSQVRTNVIEFGLVI